MPDPGNEDETVKTPGDNGEKITPLGATPPESRDKSELSPSDPTLAALRQRYDVLAEIGRGGMGRVYRAHDRETGDTIALKVLKPEIASQPNLIERFKLELLLARKITHKNVCRVYDLNRFGETAAISMEYIEGESLRSLLNRVEGLSVKQGLKIIGQVMAGLAEAHAQSVVHRDLKPENILITRDGTVKVMDFGIARSVEGKTSDTSSILGTPAYMSPEQAEGKRTDTRTDIYSLGLVAYEMFAGQPAFFADTPVGLAYKQVHDRPAPLGSLDLHLPVFLELAIEKCLEKEPQKRFQSIAEIEFALSARGVPTPVDSEPLPAPHLSRGGRGDWGLVALSAIGFVYFLAYRDTVFPASRMRLQVDAIGARRAVQEMASRLGQPIPGDAQAETELELRQDIYLSQAVYYVFGPTTSGTKSKPLPTPGWSGEPLVWRTSFRLPIGGAPIKVEVDRQGKIKRLSLPAFIPGSYRPASLEDRRVLAKRVAETVCGSIPANYELGDTQGGEQGATYDAVWRAKGDLPSFVPRLRVSFLAEKVKEVDCNPREGLDYFNVDTGAWRWFTGSVVAALVLVLFLVGRCYASRWLWRRLTLAVPLGLTAEWTIHTALGWPDVPLPVYALEFLPVAGLMLIALVTSEHFLWRDAPESAASYLAVLKGQVRRPEVGFAILRGAMAGMVLAALETLFAHRSLLADQAQLNLGRPSSAAFFLALVDPLPMARALASFIPTLFGVCSAILDGVIVGVVFLGLPLALLRRSEVRVKHLPWYRRPMPALSAGLIWWVTGFHFCLAEFVLPPLGLVWAFLLEAILLAWLLSRYDVLTVIVAVATTVLWVINYPLLVIFSEVGNTGEWAVFIGWGLVILAAAVVAFRSTFARAGERLQANIQR
jgi:serine/threonine protein kinase